VRQLRELNFALIGKWCWRLLVDRGGLWYKVLVARYGEEAVKLEVGAGVFLFGGGKIRYVVGEVEGDRFLERMSRKVGDGTYTLFWCDRWFGEVPFCRRFSRLFDLAANKSSTVTTMFSL